MKKEYKGLKIFLEPYFINILQKPNTYIKLFNRNNQINSNSP